MNNKSLFLVLAGMIVLNILAFGLANAMTVVPSWLNYTMVGVELFCFILFIFGRIKGYKNIDSSVAIVLNIFLLLILATTMILSK
ncbi:MAG: hypothetical protein ACLVKO_09020 [Dysgonomonas sp.]